MTRRDPTLVEHLPDGEFYAILRPETITVWNGNDATVWMLEVFPDRATWQREILKLETSSNYVPPYKAVRCSPAKISTTVTVEDTP